MSVPTIQEIQHLVNRIVALYPTQDDLQVLRDKLYDLEQAIARLESNAHSPTDHATLDDVFQLRTRLDEVESRTLTLEEHTQPTLPAPRRS